MYVCTPSFHLPKRAADLPEVVLRDVLVQVAEVQLEACQVGCLAWPIHCCFSPPGATAVFSGTDGIVLHSLQKLLFPFEPQPAFVIAHFPINRCFVQ